MTWSAQNCPEYSIHMPAHMCTHTERGSIITILEYSSSPPHSPSCKLCLTLSHLIITYHYVALLGGSNLILVTSSLFSHFWWAPLTSSGQHCIHSLLQARVTSPFFAWPQRIGPLPCCFPSQTLFCLHPFLILRIKYRMMNILKLDLNLSEKPKLRTEDIKAIKLRISEWNQIILKWSLTLLIQIEDRFFKGRHTCTSKGWKVRSFFRWHLSCLSKWHPDSWLIFLVM